MHRSTHLLLPLLVATSLLTLTQCVTTDPGFQPLEATATTDAKADAVVGMWHRKHDAADFDIRARMSLLFNRDGTGISRFVETTNGQVDERNSPFRWSYAGNGQWSLNASGSVSPIRMSGNQLLMNVSGGGRRAQYVYEKVSE